MFYVFFKLIPGTQLWLMSYSSPVVQAPIKCLVSSTENFVFQYMQLSGFSAEIMGASFSNNRLLISSICIGQLPSVRFASHLWGVEESHHNRHSLFFWRSSNQALL